jgi:hypothetical protein
MSQAAQSDSSIPELPTTTEEIDASEDWVYVVSSALPSPYRALCEVGLETWVPDYKHWGFTAVVAVFTTAAVAGCSGAAAIAGGAAGAGIGLITGAGVVSTMSACATGAASVAAAATAPFGLAAVVMVFAGDLDLSGDTGDK